MKKWKEKYLSKKEKKEVYKSVEISGQLKGQI